jgi:hypothetical protein
MPPRIMFLGKHRPKQFEFPICRSCNSVSSKSELVASFFARSWLDLGKEDLSDELKRIMKALVENHPGTVEEILKGSSGTRHRKKALRANTGVDFDLLEVGQIATEHLRIFNAKMAMAAWYEKTKVPLSINGGVVTKISTSVDAIEGTLPKIDVDMTEFETIKQGQWTVENQFVYRQAFTENSDAALFQFLYHQNYLATSFVFSDRSLSKIEASAWVTPGKFVAVTDKITNPLSKYSYSYILKM